MSGKLQTININEIINYFENPRHIVGSDEKDTLKKLFTAVGVQYMLNLAEDIGNNGLLGNQQVVVVYSEQMGKYVVYEGNRRIAALKLLLNPSFFDFLDKSTLDKAKKISENSKPIYEINCYATDEQEAFFIMERVHSGEDKGRGTKKWTSREKEVFNVRRSKAKTLSYLIDYYVKKYFDGYDITTVLPFTTIQRIFNNREIKKLIGLDINQEESFNKERMQLILNTSNWIVKEAEAEGLAVTRLFNDAKSIEERVLPWIKQYLDVKNSNTSKDITKKEVANNQIPNDMKTESDSNKPQIEKASNNNKEVNNSRQNEQPISLNTEVSNGTGNNKNLPYFFQGLNYHQLNPNDADTHGIAAVCREIQLFSDRKIVSTYPLAAAFLTRSVIEQAIKYYSKKHKIQGQNKYIWDNIMRFTKLSKIIEDFNKNLPNYITDRTIRQYFKSLFSDYEQNVDPLNWVIHRPSEFQLDSTTLVELPRRGLLALINYLLS